MPGLGKMDHGRRGDQKAAQFFAAGEARRTKKLKAQAEHEL